MLPTLLQQRPFSWYTIILLVHISLLDVCLIALEILFISLQYIIVNCLIQVIVMVTNVMSYW